MDKELIERLAKEAGASVESWLTNPPKPGLFYFSPEQLEKFAAMVAEECEKKARPVFSRLLAELIEARDVIQDETGFVSDDIKEAIEMAQGLCA